MTPPNTAGALELLERFLSTPTAPFHEERVRNLVEDTLRSIPGARLARDDFGNLTAFFHCSGHQPDPPPVVFVVHMDHPGWITPRGADVPVQGLPYRFAGSVPEEFLAEPDVVDFGEFAMWNLPAFDVRGEYILSRACDDLAGCALLISAVLDLAEAGVEKPFGILFTRAEEVGLLGSLIAAEAGVVDPASAVISIETSNCKPPTKFGQGPVVRVGDRSTIFSPWCTGRILSAARTEKITVQRCLMDGGVCEASIYAMQGYDTGGICLPLGNYHNCGPDNQILPEFIHRADYLAAVSLTAAIIENWETADDYDAALRDRIATRLSEYRPYFA